MTETPGPVPCADAELVLAARAGDRAAFAELILSHRPLALNLALVAGSPIKVDAQLLDDPRAVDQPAWQNYRTRGPELVTELRERQQEMMTELRGR